MAQCEGTTSSGEQCKLEAKEDSRFCHLHGEDSESEAEEGTGTAEEAAETEQEEAATAKQEEAVDEDAAAAEEALCWEDVANLALAGVVVAGMFFFIRAFGKWMPKI